MKQYKLGDKVRVSDEEGTNYEDAEERIFMYKRDGFIYCVTEDNEVEYEENYLLVTFMRWNHIIEKPIEYTLKGDELKAVLQSIEPDKISEHLRNDLINVRHELRKLTK